MWLSAIKLAVSAGSKIYANKQRTKMAMSDAQLMHAQKMAEGKEAYQGKLLEARQSDWKDEAVLIILSLPVVILAWAVVSDDPGAMEKVKLFFDMFSQLPSWFTNLWILVVASIYGIKGTQIFRNVGKKIMDKKLKPIPAGNKGLPKLPKEVRNNMGFLKDGGIARLGFNDGGFEPFKFTSKIPKVFKEDTFAT